MNKFLETLNENITNDERKYRQFMAIVNIYAPNTEAENITVQCTSKGNYRILDENGKKICLISKNCIDIDSLQSKGITIDCPQE